MSFSRAQQAQYRPLVKRAWLAHCELTGVPPNNRQAQDDWYREQLWSACRIRSTRDATADEYRTLIKRFTLLSEAGDTATVKGFTPAQNSVFSPLVAKAWRSVCRRDATGLQFHEWLDKELAACGIHGRKARDHVEQFDDVMSHFACIAGDLYWIERTSQASEIRMRYILVGKMAELARVEQRPVDWNYCRAIYSRMNLPLTLEEADARWLWKLVQAIDTHLRRLRKRQEPASVG